LVGLLCAAAVIGVLASTGLAAAESPTSSGGMTLVFTGAKARNVGPQNVAVPVRCLGEPRGLCSGVVTLSRNGHRYTEPFSVSGGRREFLFVPLGHCHLGDRAKKVRGLASTVGTAGYPTQDRTLFYAG
jgi:hypothetical protein